MSTLTDEQLGIGGDIARVYPSGGYLLESAMLLPCPFCGESDASVVEQLDVDSPHDDNPITYTAVMCGVCGAMGPCKHDGLDEVQVWNRRPE